MENKKKKILIIDDDEMVRGIYVDVLRNENFEVLESGDGLDGLQSAIANRPDIIFTGIIMPRMDGMTLIQELKKNTVTANIPVVISSHLGREEDRKRAEELGAKNFFIKDLDTPKEVVARIKNIFEKGVYRLKFDKEALDGPNLGKNMKDLSDSLEIKITNFEKGEFVGKFVEAEVESEEK